MLSSPHITLEKLLLWQDGELSPQEAEAVRKHLQVCKECQRELAELEDFNAETEWANARVMQRRLHARVKENERSPLLRRLDGLLEPLKQHKFWTSLTASTVIAALLLVSITNFTPAARADVLLTKATRQEQQAGFHAHTLRIRNGDAQCSVSVAGPTVQNLLASSQVSFCDTVSQRLRQIGWEWSSLLSAQKFEQWRSSLSRKHDSIKKLEDETEVTTSTEDGPIRKATMGIRNSDYHPTEARFQFADDFAGEEIKVREAPLEPNTIEIVSKEATSTPRFSREPKGPSVTQQRDETEAKVRLALHRIGVDKNILVAVEPQASGIRVWGVVPTDTQKESIIESLAGIPDVTAAVITDVEEQALQASLPWQASHGTALPLASEQMDNLFAGNLDARQAFQNDLDIITRRLVGAAKTRDGLIALSQREPSAPYAAELNRAIAGLDIQMKADQQMLQQRLQPVIGLPAIHPRPLTYAEAMQVYTIVHDVALVSGSDAPPTLEQATAQLHRFLR